MIRREQFIGTRTRSQLGSRVTQHSDRNPVVRLRGRIVRVSIVGHVQDLIAHIHPTHQSLVLLQSLRWLSLILQACVECERKTALRETCCRDHGAERHGGRSLQKTARICRERPPWRSAYPRFQQDSRRSRKTNARREQPSHVPSREPSSLHRTTNRNRASGPHNRQGLIWEV